MSKQQNNHKANQGNANEGTSGTNQAYAKVQGNKGKQMNPNQKKQRDMMWQATMPAAF